jgi:uncharacterized protein
MKSKLLQEGDVRIFAVVFDSGDEVTEGLLSFAREYGFRGAGFVGIGAFESATLAFFELESNEYEEIPIDEQVEVLSFAGNLGVHEGEPKLHAHVVVGRRDGSTRGGHLLRARVRPTLELIVTETVGEVRRIEDQATGLPLIDHAA